MSTVADDRTAEVGEAVLEWAGRFDLSVRDIETLVEHLRADSGPPVSSPLSPREQELLDPHVEDVSPGRRADMLRQSLETKATLDSVALSSEKAAAHAGVTGGRLRQLASAGRIWAWREHGQWRIPTVQFHDRRLLPGWETVFAQIPDSATPVSVYRFLTVDRAELDDTSVRDWLAAGGSPRPVVDIVRGWHGP